MQLEWVWKGLRADPTAPTICSENRSRQFSTLENPILDQDLLSCESSDIQACTSEAY